MEFNDVNQLLRALPISERFHMPLNEVENLDTWTIDMLHLIMRAQNQKMEFERKKAEFYGR